MNLKNLTASYRTTIGGIGALAVLWGEAIKLLADGNAATNPDWNIVIAGTLAAIGLIFARDNSTTSVKAGAE